MLSRLNSHNLTLFLFYIHVIFLFIIFGANAFCRDGIVPSFPIYSFRFVNKNIITLLMHIGKHIQIFHTKSDMHLFKKYFQQNI